MKIIQSDGCAGPETGSREREREIGVKDGVRGIVKRQSEEKISCGS